MDIDQTVADRPSAAFYADPRADHLFLAETVSSLIARHAISRAFVDMSSTAGLVVAAELMQAGVAYEEIRAAEASTAETSTPAETSTVPSDYRFKPGAPRTMADLPYLRRMSAGHRLLPLTGPQGLAELETTVVLIAPPERPTNPRGGRSATSQSQRAAPIGSARRGTRRCSSPGRSRAAAATGACGSASKPVARRLSLIAAPGATSLRSAHARATFYERV